MKVVIYLKGGSSVPAMAMCVEDNVESINIDGFTKAEVLPENIVNTGNVPVGIDTFMANFDKFVYSGDNTIRHNSNLVLDNRKIDTLSETTGMAIGRSNTTELFNVL